MAVRVAVSTWKPGLPNCVLRKRITTSFHQACLPGEELHILLEALTALKLSWSIHESHLARCGSVGTANISEQSSVTDLLVTGKADVSGNMCSVNGERYQELDASPRIMEGYRLYVIGTESATEAFVFKPVSVFTLNIWIAYIIILLTVILFLMMQRLCSSSHLSRKFTSSIISLFHELTDLAFNFQTLIDQIKFQKQNLTTNQIWGKFIFLAAKWSLCFLASTTLLSTYVLPISYDLPFTDETGFADKVASGEFRLMEVTRKYPHTNEANALKFQKAVDRFGTVRPTNKGVDEIFNMLLNPRVPRTVYWGSSSYLKIQLSSYESRWKLLLIPEYARVESFVYLYRKNFTSLSKPMNRVILDMLQMGIVDKIHKFYNYKYHLQDLVSDPPMPINWSEINDIFYTYIFLAVCAMIVFLLEVFGNMLHRQLTSSCDL